MSATTHTTETYTCPQCGGSRTPQQSVGGFCSEKCLHRHRGEKALNRIESDHRWCATCFRQIKTTSRPSEDWTDRGSSMLNAALEHGGTYSNGAGEITLDATECSHARPTATDSVIGYQYRTDNATDGVDEAKRTDESGCRIEYTRTSCQCGAVNPSDQHEVLRNLDPAETIQSLWKCLVRLEEHGTLQHRPSKSAYLDALRESNYDWTYAIGRALYADA